MNERQKLKAKKAFTELLNFYGGECSQLARAIDVSPILVRKWKTREAVSRQGALAIEAKLNVPAVSLRPDLVGG